MKSCAASFRGQSIYTYNARFPDITVHTNISVHVSCIFREEKGLWRHSNACLFSQLSVDAAAEAREMAGRAVSSTAFPLSPVTFTCADPTLGASYTGESITLSRQPNDVLQSPLYPSRALSSAEAEVSQAVLQNAAAS